MEVFKFEIDGPALLTPPKFDDARGFFTERFRCDRWSSFLPNHPGFIQDNFSWSNYGVLRGLHYQYQPDQGKLVTTMFGRITDVIVDIRRNSPTLGQHLKVTLTGEQPQWLWVPSGFAHGFVVTSKEGAGVLYKVDASYSPRTEGAIRWNDPDLKISWPIENPVTSVKDDSAGTFQDFLSKLN